MELSKEQQVAALKQKYEQELQAIQQEVPASPELVPTPEAQEHQAVSQATEGVIQEQMPSFKASSHEPISTEVSPQVQGMVTESLLNGPYKSIEAIQNANDSALADEYHRALTSNESWHALVKEGKIPEL